MTRRGDWTQTSTGRQFWPLDPRAEDVDIEDIAHALSNVCRFNGHVREFYSVAQHSVLVAEMVPPADRLWGLLHDASEAYLCDLVRPVKTQPEFAEYRAMEQRLMVAICDRFGLPHEMPQSVREADERMLATEKRDLLTLSPADWKLTAAPYTWPIQPMFPRAAKRWFLDTFTSLQRMAERRAG